MEINPLVPPTDGGGLMSKIMGGSDLTPNSLPYLVHYKYNGNHLCGGAIINALYILTAAHCLQYNDNPQNFKVIIHILLIKHNVVEGAEGFNFEKC